MLEQKLRDVTELRHNLFDAYVRYVLIPTRRLGGAVIMDNLSSHKRASVR